MHMQTEVGFLTPNCNEVCDGIMLPGQDLVAYGIVCYDCLGCPDKPDCENPEEVWINEEVWLNTCTQPTSDALPLLKSSAYVRMY